MAKPLLDLGWMRTFAEVGRCGSLSAAAQRLAITQPAVSYQIRKIEEQLGVELLTRTHRGVDLTFAGQQLFDIVDRYVREVDIAANRISEKKKTVVRLFADFAFASLWLIPRIHLFQREFPDIDLQIVSAQHIRPDATESQDVVISFESRAAVGSDAVLLIPERVVPLCSQQIFARIGAASPLAEIARMRLVHLDAATPVPWHSWDSYFRSFGIRYARSHASGDISFNTYSLVIQAAISNQGVALGWLGLVDSLLGDGVLMRAGPELLVQDRGYWLIRPERQGGPADKLSRWLMSEAVEELRDQTGQRT